ncbi:MAG: hypothetical protein J1G04_04930 [Clostridiales bacterium]|nr:hypothetical protein [Clostridiales bacterium]
MNFKKILDFFIKPRIWFLLIVMIIAVGAIVGTAIIMTQDGPTILGFVFLGIMVVSVGYSVYGIIKVLPTVQERAMKWSENRPFWNRLFTEYGFRTIFFSIGAFIINIAFAIYNGTVAIIIGSIWFGALAAYYVFLIVLRGGILIYHSRRRKAIANGQTEEKTHLRDTKVYGKCGIILVLLPIALTPAIVQMVRANNAFIHTGLTIYAYAVYAFYKIGMAIYNFVKTRKTNEMTVRASKNINLADAFVSILALQTAMFHEFGTGMGDFNIGTMNAITGAAVCALTAAIGIFMIVVTTKILKKSK